jgi:hypothetical protein
MIRDRIVCLCLHQLFPILWFGRTKDHVRPRPGMPEAQSARVQGMSQGFSRPFRLVKVVLDEWVPDGCHVHANLVGASGMKGRLEFGHVSVSSQDTVGRVGKLAVTADTAFDRVVDCAR